MIDFRTSMLLRVLSDAVITAKGTQLTFPELDTNQQIIANTLARLEYNPVYGAEAYNAAKAYVGGTTYYVSYGGNIWKFISLSTQTGITPGSNTLVWQLSSIGVYAHQRNTDTQLISSGGIVITGDQILSYLSTGGHTIQDEGLELPPQPVLNFVGPGVTVSDGIGQTVVTISGSTIAIDAIPTNGSINAVSSDGVFDALAFKADLVDGKVPPSQLPVAGAVSGIPAWDITHAYLTYDVVSNLGRIWQAKLDIAANTAGSNPPTNPATTSNAYWNELSQTHLQNTDTQLILASTGAVLTADSIQTQLNSKAPLESPVFTTKITTPFVYGSSSAAGTLTLGSTSHLTTKGKILFGTSAYDEANNYLGLHTNSPDARLTLKYSGGADDFASTAAIENIYNGTTLLGTMNNLGVRNWNAYSAAGLRTGTFGFGVPEASLYAKSGSASTGKAFFVENSAGTMLIRANNAGVIETNKVITSTTYAGGSLSLDLATTDIWRITLTGNITAFDVTNLVAGRIYKIYFIQDATGYRTIAGLAAKFKTEDARAILLSTGAGAVDMIQLEVEDTSTVGVYPVYNRS